MSGERVVIFAMMLVNGICLWLLEGRAPHDGGRRADSRRHLGPNLALTGLLVVLNFLFDRVAVAAGLAPRDGIGLPGWRRLPAWAGVVTTVVLLDGLAYMAHLLMHKLPAAWRFHRVHHSDAQVDVTTAFRQHPFETAWRYSFLFAGATLLESSSSAVAVYLAVSVLNAQLEHAAVALPGWLDGALRLVVATPAMHRVHHSRRLPETDRNYSNIFSFWDRLFGTYRAPRAGEAIVVGLDDWGGSDRERTIELLALPFEPQEGPS
jgi:sterol desaturase/sphingolipid hydroxylase (fatty acid hydroxylase superfamily)